MKWLIIFAIFVFAFAYIYYRFRKQIKTAYLMWMAFRQIRSQLKANSPKSVDKSKSDSPLVRCPTCGKWTAEDAAVKLKSNYYCSLSCMENAMVKAS